MPCRGQCVATTIQGEVYKRLRPRLTEAFKAGQTVPFGPLQMSPRGLQVREELLPWESVGRVTV